MYNWTNKIYQVSCSTERAAYITANMLSKRYKVYITAMLEDTNWVVTNKYDPRFNLGE